MKIAFALAGLPSYGNHGGAQTCMGLIRQMQRMGHHVEVVSLYDVSARNPYLPNRKENEEQLRRLNVPLHYVEFKGADLFSKAPRAFWQKGLDSLLDLTQPSLTKHYPWANLKRQISSVLESVKPDSIFCYHFEPLAALHGLKTAPIIAGVGDLVHEPIRLSWKQQKPRPSPGYISLTYNALSAARVHGVLMKDLLQQCAVHGAFAAHYAEWFRREGLETHYFRTPVSDPLQGKDWKAERAKRLKPNAPIKILLIGDVNATATRLGLEILAQDIAPNLLHEAGSQSHEFHIVGRGTLAPKLKQALDLPTIRIRGVVDPADEEFLNSQVLLVPTPVDLGIRVRILTGFAYGNCIVTHKANAAGIPELSDGENAVVGDSGDALAAGLLRLIKEPALRKRLSEESRRTYETTFSEEAAATPIVRLMEEFSCVPA